MTLPSLSRYWPDIRKEVISYCCKRMFDQFFGEEKVYHKVLETFLKDSNGLENCLQLRLRSP